MLYNGHTGGRLSSFENLRLDIGNELIRGTVALDLEDTLLRYYQCTHSIDVGFHLLAVRTMILILIVSVWKA